MTKPLTPHERTLFEALITASTTLCTVANNAATVLSEEFQDMVTVPLTAVQDILSQCPTPSERWDGSFNQADCDIDYYTPDMPAELRQGRINTGVKVTHRMTGLSVSAYQSAEPERNLASAMRVLQQRVEANSRAQGLGSHEDPLH